LSVCLSVCLRMSVCLSELIPINMVELEDGAGRVYSSVRIPSLRCCADPRFGGLDLNFRRRDTYWFKKLFFPLLTGRRREGIEWVINLNCNCKYLESITIYRTSSTNLPSCVLSRKKIHLYQKYLESDHYIFCVKSLSKQVSMF